MPDGLNTVIFTLGGYSATMAHLAVLAGLVVAFGLGWWLGARRSRGQGRPPLRLAASGRTASDDAFLRGVSHMMADHTDQAIEEFTRAVTLNSDTVETYVVLGNLFRQKGEIERAVRIRQSIIARPNLDKAISLQALYDLGLDYRKGGLFNRAVDAFKELLSMDPNHVEASRQMITLYEEMRDWEKALDSARRLDKLTGEDSRPVQAHYLTELGKEHMAAGRLDDAASVLGKAISVHKECLDAYLHLGDLEMARGRVRKALNLWRKAVRLAPLHAHLVVGRVSEAEESGEDTAFTTFFDEFDLDQAEFITLLSLAERYHRRGDEQKALELLDRALAKGPGQLDAHRLRGEILLSQGRDEAALAAYREFLDQLRRDWITYQCEQCGFVSHSLSWKCPRCHQWDSMTPRTQSA